MTVFDDYFETAFATLLDQFGESVIYKTKDGTERVIDAIVDRSPPEFFTPAGDVSMPFAEIRVHDDATKGIAVTELNTGTDTIQISNKTGETATFRPLVKLLSGDGGVTQIRVR